MKSFSNKYKEEQRKKVQLSNSQLEIKIMSQRNEIERKEKLSENKRKYFDQLKSMAVKREKDFNKVKSDEMLRALEKKKQQEYIKMVQYVEKHEKINSQKKAMDLLSKDKTEQQMNIINEKLKEMKDKKGV